LSNTRSNHNSLKAGVGADTLSHFFKKLIRQAVNAELEELLGEYSEQKVDGKQAVIRNGFLPEQTIQTGLGDIDIQVPKIRDKSKQGIKFNSLLIPPYLKRTESIEELLPVLYLKGISTGDFSEALKSLLGANAKGLSAGTISRLKQQWRTQQR
jgi:transposase-like protein